MIDPSKEIRRLPASDPGPDPIHVGLVYANTYPVAISSLGFQTIHRIASSHPGVVAHRIVLKKEDGRSYPTATLEEGLSIRSLDALFISCSFEPDYLHLVRILNEAGIPALRRNRGALPLVIIGGIAPTANPEPVAMIADAIAIGDGEITFPDLLDDLLEVYPLLQGARFDKGRAQLCELWDQHEGIYVPALWEDGKGNFRNRDEKQITQASMDNLDDYPSYTPVISPYGVYGAKNLISISTGCPAGCRFCLLSYMVPSRKTRSISSLLENARMFAPEEASIGLISGRVSDFTGLADAISTMSSEGYEVSVSSLRISTTTPELLGALVRSGTKSATFAPEHGSERIRELICKKATYEEVREKTRLAFDAGMNRVKLYFLTGFEEETESDLTATTEFILSLVSDIDLMKRPAHCRIEVALAPFVPKPVTPFQRRAMLDEKTLKRRMKTILNPLKKHPRIDIETESPRTSIIQGILSVNDRSISKVLDSFSQTRGPLLQAWDSVMNDYGKSVKIEVLKDRTNESLPWGFIRRAAGGSEST